MRLPYAPRTGQNELISFLESFEGVGVAEASTGTGKTISALVAAYNRGGPIIVATRTNSQQRQFLSELNALKTSGQDVGLVVPLMGRKQYCPHLAKPEYKDGSAEEWGRLCRRAKNMGTCSNFETLKRDGTGPIEAILRETVASHQEFSDKVVGCGSCPYEALKELLPQADVALVPAVFLLDPGLRNSLLNWMGRNPSECSVILDEAHHIPSSARDHFSATLRAATIQRAMNEAPPVSVAGRFSIQEVLMTVRGLLMETQQFLKDDDGRVPSGFAAEWLMQSLSVPSPVLESICTDLLLIGEQIKEEKEEQGKLPRSYVGFVGAFLQRLLFQAGDTATIARAEELELAMLDAAAVLDWQSEFASVTHMSGTLRPLRLHQALCGIDGPTFEWEQSMPGLQLYCMQGVHRKWKEFQEDPALAAHHQELAEEFLASCKGRTALFFPSHAMLDAYLEEGFLHGHPHLFREQSGQSTPELTRMLASFVNGPETAILLAVLGGRISEGMDFPGDALRNICIMGVPYPKPSAKQNALQEYLELHHPGEGWNLSVQVPVGRVMRQAIGRLIRSPNDKGTALILDERGVRFRAQLPPMLDISSIQEIGTPMPESGFFRGGTSIQSRKS